MEIWKPVLNFEDLYEVSNFGNVRRIARSKKLDASKIPRAKEMLNQGATLKQVACFLETSITTVQSIKKGKTWAGDARFRPLKARVDSRHYGYVDFVRDSTYYKMRVHRVVWEAFNGPIPDRLEINHKDLNRTNNCLDNLEIVTHRENLKHAIDRYAAEGKFRAIKGVKGFIAGRHSDYDN